MTHSSLSSSHDKWQAMLAIVNQHTALWRSNPELRLQRLMFYRWGAENFLTFLLQYTGLTFSTLSTSISFIWFASGTAFTLLLLRGNTILPGMWLGSFVAFYLANFPLGLTCGYATLFLLQSMLLRWLCYHWVGPTLLFYRKSTLGAFLLCSGFVTAVTSLVMSSYGQWLSAWLANWNGILIVACTLIAWDAYFAQVTSLKKEKIIAISSSYILLLSLTIALLFNDNPAVLIGLAIAIGILFFITRLCFDWCVSLTALFLCALVLEVSLYLSVPAFSGNQAPLTLLFLQALFLQFTLQIFIRI